jgi:hypothetical protein
MSFVNISLIFELLHAANRSECFRASECDLVEKHDAKHVVDGFEVLHRYGLVMAKCVVDEDRAGWVDYEVSGLTERGKQIYKTFLQTRLAFGDQ